MIHDIPVNPAVLKWARECAGYTAEEVAMRLRRKTVSAETVTAWEEGKSSPSYTQLEDLAYFVTEIFKVSHFQSLINQKARLEGKPVADPFIIAMAGMRGGCVVTQEKHKENAAKIPNICQNYKVACIDLEGFMEKEDWTF